MALMKYVRVSGVVIISLLAMPTVAPAQYSDWEECNLQCRADYGNGPLYLPCRNECTRIYGPPPRTPLDWKLEI
jgi:hypothetical protein